MKSVAVSIVVPAYNEERDLPLALESFRMQTRQGSEIIVIDDGSTDTTRDVVRQRFPEVLLLEQQHQGTGAARNLGARRALGSILVFTDADIIFEPDTLAKLVEPIESGVLKAANWYDERVYEPQRLWSKCWQIAHHLPHDSRMPVGYDVTQSHVLRAVCKDYFWSLGGFDVSKGIHDDHLSPEPVTMLRNVRVYHINPTDLQEIGATCAWFGKGVVAKGGVLQGIRKLLGTYSLPLSVIKGLHEAWIHRLPIYVFFKVYLDLAVSWGIVLGLCRQRPAK